MKLIIPNNLSFAQLDRIARQWYMIINRFAVNGISKKNYVEGGSISVDIVQLRRSAISGCRF